MLEHILIGVNPSEEAVDAIALGHYLARRTGAGVTAIHAQDLRRVPPEERAAAAERESRPLFELVAAEFTGIELETRAVADSSPARALTQAAEETGADLVVIGSTHRGIIGRVLPGSVGDRLLHGCPCPVAVAPRGYARRRHIGVGLIGIGYVDTPEGRLALADAKELATELAAQLRVIAVADFARRGAELDDSLELTQGAVEAGLAAAGAELGAAVDHETVLVAGEAAPALAEQGIELDLLLVGSRGYGPVGRTLLGAVSAELIRTAPCPVIVVPRAAAGARAVPSGAAEPDGAALPP